MKNIITISVLAIACLFSCSKEKKIGYLENYMLYSSFDLAKELEQELTNYENGEKKYLDSLNLIFEQQTNYLQSLEEVSKLEYASYNDLRNTLSFRQNGFEEGIQTRSQDYERQVWERLNTYVTAFASEKEYDLILGAAGNGSLMYANEDMDITAELVIYCNAQYNGNGAN